MPPSLPLYSPPGSASSLAPLSLGESRVLLTTGTLKLTFRLTDRQIPWSHPRALAPNQLGRALPRPAVGGAALGAGPHAGRVLTGPGPSILYLQSGRLAVAAGGLVLQSVVGECSVEPGRRVWGALSRVPLSPTSLQRWSRGRPGDRAHWTELQAPFRKIDAWAGRLEVPGGRGNPWAGLAVSFVRKPEKSKSDHPILCPWTPVPSPGTRRARGGQGRW